MSSTRDRVFLDTNVLVYLFDASSPAKQARARSLIEELGASSRAVLSTQVLQEFYVSVTRKLSAPLPESDAEAAVEALCVLPVVTVDPSLVLRGISVARRHRLSFWDGLVVATAAAAGCRMLLSEDLRHGLELAGVSIENPFLQ